MEMSISDNILQKYDSRSEIGGLQDAMMCGLDTVTQTKRQQQAELRMLGFSFGMIRMDRIRNGLNMCRGRIADILDSDFSLSLKCKLVVLNMKPLERRETSKVKLSWKKK